MISLIFRDVGFASWRKIPLSKGYDYFYGYLGKNIDYFSKLSDNPCYDVDDRDLWEGQTPASNDVNGHEFVETVLKQKVIDIIEAYDADAGNPFFLVYASHLPHSPSMVPHDALEEDVYDDDTSLCSLESDPVFPGFDDSAPLSYKCRTILQSQVNLLDVYVGQVVEALKAQGLWDDTLVVLTSDNGGSLKLDETAGNNYPLRGGKGTDFEGGVRVVSVVSGGFLPVSRRGAVEDGYMHVCDWYATFCGLANVSDSDQHAVDHGLPDIDALDMWPLISGQVDESPRIEIPITRNTLIYRDYKFMNGVYKYAMWQAEVWPVSSTPNQSMLQGILLDCSQEPCLFNIAEDAEERIDIAHMHPNVVQQLGELLEKLAQGFYENQEHGTDSCPDNFAVYSEGTTAEYCGCWMAMHNYGGFDGPYQDLEPAQMHFDFNYKETREQNVLLFLWSATNPAISLGISAVASAAAIWVGVCCLFRRRMHKAYAEIET